MEKTTLTNTALAAASVVSLGVLAGCTYCQPLLVATVITLVIAHWLPSAHRGTHHENFAS
jgi:hypothetical protein